MNNNFIINYKGLDIMIEQLPADQYNNTFFTVHMPGENLLIEYTEDDEGAGRWLDTKANHQTEVSTEIGHLIDLYHMQQKVNI